MARDVDVVSIEDKAMSLKSTKDAGLYFSSNEQMTDQSFEDQLEVLLRGR